MATPLFPIPAGAVADVSIVDTTSRIRGIAADYLMEPAVEGFDTMPEIPAWSFLVESPGGKKALFDLGVPKDWRSFSPEIQKHLETSGWEVEVTKDTADILTEHGRDLHEVGSIIWSHWHWDHLGDPSTFPPSTELVVGPGFKENFMPGWPAQEKGVCRESDFKGRNVREITFADSDLQIGDFRAVDHFGDGSFYLLDTPGHAIGHLCGLARTTTNPDTFIMMGGDLCHHGGEIRPSEYIPLNPKDSINTSPRYGPPCPGASTYHAIQTQRNRSPAEPFFVPAMGYNIPQTVETIRHAQKADASPHILFVYAHDASVWGTADLFPLKANHWHAAGWRDRMFWAFLRDFAAAYDQNKVEG